MAVTARYPTTAGPHRPIAELQHSPKGYKPQTIGVWCTTRTSTASKLHSELQRLLKAYKSLPGNTSATVLPLPLAVSLKKALVFAASEEHIPRTHARRLLALLQLQRV